MSFPSTPHAVRRGMICQTVHVRMYCTCHPPCSKPHPHRLWEAHDWMHAQLGTTALTLLADKHTAVGHTATGVGGGGGVSQTWKNHATSKKTYVPTHVYACSPCISRVMVTAGDGCLFSYGNSYSHTDTFACADHHPMAMPTGVAHLIMIQSFSIP